MERMGNAYWASVIWDELRLKKGWPFQCYKFGIKFNLKTQGINI